MLDLLVSFVHTYLHKLFGWLSEANSYEKEYTPTLFCWHLPSRYFLGQTCSKTKLFMCLFIHYHQIPEGEEHVKSAWWCRDTQATWPSRCQLLYGNRSTEEIILIGWNSGYIYVIYEVDFCMLPCCLHPGEREQKIYSVDLLHWRNSTVKLFLLAFVSLYFLQTLNCSPLNAISYCFIVWFYFAWKPPWCSTLLRHILKSTKILCMLSLLQLLFWFFLSLLQLLFCGCSGRNDTRVIERCLSCFSYCCGQPSFTLLWSNSSTVRMSFIPSGEVPTRVGTQ